MSNFRDYGVHMKFLRHALISLCAATAMTVVPAVGEVSAIDGPSPWVAKKSSRAFGKSVFSSSMIGASAVFSVPGKKFTVWYFTGPKNGKVAVYVNGKRNRVLDQYAGSAQRKSFTVTKAASSNRVMFVVLATRHKKSRGRNVNIDAFSSTTKCLKGCVTNPIPLSQQSGVSELGTTAEWYPSGVPAKADRNWTVAIGSYVRGRDVSPIDNAVPVIRAAACDQARKVPRGVVVLSFGMQNSTFTNGFGQSITASQIIATTSAWATGLAECGTGPWEVAIGTSNSGSVTAYNGYLGGKAWAKLVTDARAVSDPRTVVSGAVDLEPGWGPPGQARAWVDGYVDSTQLRLWNFGSADGCPQSVSTDLTCNNGWTIDDVLWVSSHAGANVLAMPQIHTKSGSQARQWARLAARAAQMKMPLRIAAITVQTAACSQVRSGCPTTGISAWDGWLQLKYALKAIPSVADYKVGAPMDIRWGWANGFVIPPETTVTTTTTTLPPETTTTTSTTTTPPTTVPASPPTT